MGGFDKILVLVIMHGSGFSVALRTGRELRDRFGSFRYRVFSKFTGKHEADGGLDFSATECSLFVVRGEFSGLCRNALKDVLNERVHDGHALFGNTGIRVDLLEDLVDVAAVGFGALFRFLGSSSSGFLRRFCRLFAWSWSFTHVECEGRDDERWRCTNEQLVGL